MAHTFNNYLIRQLNTSLKDIFQDENETVTSFANRIVEVGNRILIWQKSKNNNTYPEFRSTVEGILIKHFYQTVNINIALELILASTLKESIENAKIIETKLKSQSIKCQLCFKRGHSAKECPLYLIQCQLCNKFGHEAPKCHYFKSEKPRVNTSTQFMSNNLKLQNASLPSSWIRPKSNFRIPTPSTEIHLVKTDSQLSHKNSEENLIPRAAQPQLSVIEDERSIESNTRSIQKNAIRPILNLNIYSLALSSNTTKHPNSNSNTPKKINNLTNKILLPTICVKESLKPSKLTDDFSTKFISNNSTNVTIINSPPVINEIKNVNELDEIKNTDSNFVVDSSTELYKKHSYKIFLYSISILQAIKYFESSQNKLDDTYKFNFESSHNIFSMITRTCTDTELIQTSNSFTSKNKVNEKCKLHTIFMNKKPKVSLNNLNFMTANIFDRIIHILQNLLTHESNSQINQVFKLMPR